MSNETQYFFIPHLRQGFAGTLEGEPTGERAELKVTLTVKSSPDDLTNNDITKTVQLYGPGDVLGFDARIVSRTDPLNNVGDFEPNYFPAIEFVDPDFPWRYTPCGPNDLGNLVPWITLVVLLAEDAPDGSKKKEYEEGQRTNVNGERPWIIVKDIASLPDLAQAWRWAHVQVMATQEPADWAQTLKTIISDEPQRIVSRLLCARRLRPGAKYTAFVVPTFELGRKVGVPEIVARKNTEPNTAVKLAWDLYDAKEVDALRGEVNTLEALQRADQGLELPYYFKWEFRTGQRGDFEHLVRLLEARSPEQLQGVGTRAMDCRDPGFGLVETIYRTELDPENEHYYGLAVEGALRTPLTRVTLWGRDRGETSPGQAEFAALLNQPRADMDGSIDRNAVRPVHAWSRAHGGSGADRAVDVALDGDGNVVLTGYFQDRINLGGVDLTGTRSRNIFLAKFGPDGTHLWSNSLSAERGEGRPGRVVCDGQGDIVLAGTFGHAIDFGCGLHENAGRSDLFLAKFDVSGKCRWSRVFIASRGRKNVWGLTIDGDDNIILTGQYQKDLNFGDPGSELPVAFGPNIFVAKFGPDGTHVWSKGFVHSGGGRRTNDAGWSVAADAADHVLVTGLFYGTINFGGKDLPSKGHSDIFLLKLDGSTGDHLASASFGSDGYNHGFGVHVNAADQVVLKGRFEGTVDFGEGHVLTNSGDRWDLFLTRLEQAGTTFRCSAAVRVGSDSPLYWIGSAMDDQGNSMVIGSFTDSLYIADKTYHSTSETADLFLARFDSQFGLVQCYTFPATNWMPRSVMYREQVDVDDKGTVVFAGQFPATINLGGATLYSSSGADLFLAKYATAPRVAPPIYGRWHRGENEVDPTRINDDWFHELNLDPRHRVAAGVGAEVVREQQEALMSAAWKQAGELEKSNQLHKDAQLGFEVSRRLERRLANHLPASSQVAITGPKHGRISSTENINGQQVQTNIKAALGRRSPKAAATLDPAFRRLRRPRGAISKRQKALHTYVGAKSKPLFDRFLKQDRAPGSSDWRKEINKVLKAERTVPARLSARVSSPLDPPIQPQMMERNGAAATAPASVPQPQSLEMLFVTPEFPQPMYEALQAVSQEWLLPGIANIPQNTVALLETNWRFVEAFMCGLNHEMTRELQWREFPAYLRGTYFRRFWDSEYDDGAHADIKPLTEWETDSLGANGDTHRPADRLVLIIRGDVLKKYPNTVIYAVKATTVTVPDTGETRRIPVLPEFGVTSSPNDIKYPVFSGTAKPDVTFISFDLEAGDALGGAGSSYPDGWYFVLEERVSETRFGLDTPNGDTTSDWPDLSWDHFGFGVEVGTERFGAYLDSPPSIELPTVNQDQWTGASSADSAGFTMQKPVRVSIHASQMLPKEGVIKQITVDVQADAPRVYTGSTVQFHSLVSGASQKAVEWSVNDIVGGSNTLGRITASGLYTAPLSVPDPDTVTIRAVSRADTSKSGSAVVTVIAAFDDETPDTSDLDWLEKMPTRDQAISRLMAVMKAPTEKLACTLKEVPGKLVRTLAAIRDQKK